jgi:hypothetical protein
VVERSNEWVKIQLGTGDPIRIPWASRQALLERVRARRGAERIVQAFEAAGTSRVVTFDAESKELLLEVIDVAWFEGERVRASDLPPGIYELRNALIDDAAARRPGS